MVLSIRRQSRLSFPAQMAYGLLLCALVSPSVSEGGDRASGLGTPFTVGKARKAEQTGSGSNSQSASEGIDPKPNPPPPPPAQTALTVDLAFDLAPGTKLDAESKRKIQERAAAIVFAINSLNKTNGEVLTVSDLLPRPPEQVPFKVEVKLSPILSASQLGQLESMLASHPLTCNGVSDVRAHSIRADVLVKTIFDRTNYSQLMGLSSRREFERELEIEPEFDASPSARARFTHTLRFLLPPGQSGVAHPNTYRFIAVQAGRENVLVFRTGDTFSNEASLPRRNYSSRPVTARANGHEEIWILPNKMRGYALRDEKGNPVTDAPLNLVQPRISNPESCIRCHGDFGFLATTGENGSTPRADIREVTVIDERDETGRQVGKKLFSGRWSQYEQLIKTANLEYEATLKKTGGSRKGLNNVLDEYNSDVSLKTLARELGVDLESLELALKGDRRFREALSFTPESASAVRAGKLPTHLSRTTLESHVATGPDQTESFFCALQQRLVAKAGQRRDALGLGNNRPTQGVH